VKDFKETQEHVYDVASYLGYLSMVLRNYSFIINLGRWYMVVSRQNFKRSSEQEKQTEGVLYEEVIKLRVKRNLICAGLAQLCFYALPIIIFGNKVENPKDSFSISIKLEMLFQFLIVNPFIMIAYMVVYFRQRRFMREL
jgi:hypothetical protein